MNIELKNVKYSQFASRETDCFEASVYIDGKKLGMVSNDGHGGCNMYSPRLREIIERFAQTQVVTKEVAGVVTSFQKDADYLIGELFSDWLRKKTYKALCKNRTLYRIPDFVYKEDQWHTIKKPYDDSMKMYLLGRFGANVRILNEEIK